MVNKLTKGVKTFAVILTIAVLSVLCGLFAEKLVKKADLAGYPKKYAEIVEKYSKLYSVPEEICYAVIKCESGFDQTAYSSAGAIGLMQIMPKTFEWLCSMAGEEHETASLYEPETNIHFGVYYLSYLYDRFGTWETAYAAYNCGPSRVDKWISEGKADADGKLSIIPIEETANYVSRVKRAAEKYREIYKIEE